MRHEDFLLACKVVTAFAIGAGLVLFTGCQASVQQPGQTAAQAQACAQNANAHNWLVGLGGVLGGAAATQGTVAGIDQAASHDLAISGAITAGVGAAAVAGGEYFGAQYSAEGCGASLPELDGGAQ